MRFLVSVGPISIGRDFSESEMNFYLKWSQRDGWQGRRIIVESLRSGGSTLKLDMCTETVRCDLNIAVLDVIYHTLGHIQDALARIRTRMIDSSDGQ